MPTVNTTCVQARYDEQLARLYYLVNYDPDSVLSYALSGVDLNDVGVIVAADINSLPNLQYETPNLPDGMVYFVQSLGIVVISSNNTWLTLDGTVVRTDGAFGIIWSWGTGASGQLGDNTIVSKSSPVSVVGGFTDWKQVSVGGYHTTGLRANGTIWAWGDNGQGRLGDNTAVSKSSPVSVVGGFTDWCQISNGLRTSSAIRTNGTAWAWGCNNCGQLGDNTLVSKSSPVSVVGGFTDWCQISMGRYHSIAIRQVGSIWSWGRNFAGTLGDDSITNRSSPVSVVGGFTDWCQISAGSSSSFAIRTNGSLWSWGYNGQGQLGINNTFSRLSPVSVVGGFTDWTSVNSTQTSALAIRSNGTLWGWGCNGQGRLGDNSTTNRSSPVSVVGGFTDWCQVSAGHAQGLAVRTNGTAWGWGCNSFGQLGDNTTTSGSSPVSVVGGFTDWCQVSTSNQNSAGLTTYD